MIGVQAQRREISIRYVKGVGPNRVHQLAQLGIETVEDACFYAPRRYEDRTRLLAIREVRPGEPVTVRGRILAKNLRHIRGRQTLFEIALGDASGVLYAKWFNQPYLAKQLSLGDELICYGQVEVGSRLPVPSGRQTGPQMFHPELERVEGDDEHSLHMGRIVPIYPLASGIGQRWLRQVIAAVVERHRHIFQDTLPELLRRSKGWPALAEAISELHFPTSWDTLETARQRLAFEELFWLQVILAQRRARAQALAKPQRYRMDAPLTDGLRGRMPFALTGSQQHVLEELLADMRGPAPMRRLLQGDVGCGKTIIVVHLIAVAVQSGYQAALMAPTELLAEQHARLITQLLAPLGVSVGLLAHGLAAAEREQRLRQIASGQLDVAVGTQALIQRDVAFARLALVVIDEQHKFGVNQRVHLTKKAQIPDVLVLTATPIPRTLALSIYGDLACSTIIELPSGRCPIATRWMREPQRPHVYAMIREQLAQGRQGYVVYPLIDERATTALRAARQMAKRLQEEIFPQFRVGLLHGQMKPSEKERVMQAFARGEAHLLVSTVIVEVGLDVPNATVMVIEHPERFGLAQLHQLRGRIGRGGHPATCVLISGSEEPAVVQRLTAFVETSDGFELAERDLEQRGPGQLLGRQQHGWLRFRIASLSRDHALMELAREEAVELIRLDPELRDPSVAALRERLALLRQRAARATPSGIGKAQGNRQPAIRKPHLQ